MPPTNPVALVVLDLFKQEDDWRATSVRWYPEPQETQNLRMYWQASNCVHGQESLVGGAVCADIPPNYSRLVQEVDNLQDEMDENKLCWLETFGDSETLLVAVFPLGWVLGTPDAEDDKPIRMKRHRKRYAAYWAVKPGGIARWPVERLPTGRQRDIPGELDAAVAEMQSVSVSVEAPAAVARAVVG